ncbi:NUDIX domain-containing protein [Candidatus Woesearchaeota archaeon]|nr:NUDIX domain-containing protein [Candidatus Woesearchaeota archaeon]
MQNSKSEVVYTKSSGGLILRNGIKGLECIIVSQCGTSFSLPKGHIERDEESIDAALREVEEEVGICPVNIEYLGKIGSYQRFALNSKGEEDYSELKTITIYLFNLLNSEKIFLKPKDPQNPYVFWLSLKEAPNKLTHPADRGFLRNNMVKIIETYCRIY